MSIVILFKITFFDCLNCWNFIPSDLEETFINTRKDKFSLNHWQDFPSRSMATLRNKRIIAAVSRETHEGSRSSRGQNVLDPELTHDYIFQVSEEIEGRVTKKLFKEISKTESRILGALSKLDEFLVNPQVRTCSVAVQGTFRNAYSENRETHGDRSSDDPYHEVGNVPHITLANSIAQRQKPNRIWWPKITLTVSVGYQQLRQSFCQCLALISCSGTKFISCFFLIWPRCRSEFLFHCHNLVNIFFYFLVFTALTENGLLWKEFATSSIAVPITSPRLQHPLQSIQQLI